MHIRFALRESTQIKPAWLDEMNYISIFWKQLNYVLKIYVRNEIYKTFYIELFNIHIMNTRGNQLIFKIIQNKFVGGGLHF